MENPEIMCNQIECLSCGDKPFSRHRHDYSSCKCGKVAVDGGQRYLRRVGVGYTDMSIVWPEDLSAALTEAFDSQEGGYTSYGFTCLVARVIRDVGYEIKETDNADLPS